MKHHYTDSDKRKFTSPSWSITYNGFGKVVLRLNDGADEALMDLTPKQAREIAGKILHCATLAETNKRVEAKMMPSGLEKPSQL